MEIEVHYFVISDESADLRFETSSIKQKSFGIVSGKLFIYIYF